MSKWKQKMVGVIALCIALSSQSIVTLATTQSQTITPAHNESETITSDKDTEKNSETITSNTESKNKDTSLDSDCNSTNILNAGEQASVDEKSSTFNVQFKSEFGQVPVVEAYIPSSKIATLPSMSAEGATFLGWYKERELTTAWNCDTDTVTEDTLLYAKWEIDKVKDYTYTLEDNVITLTKYNGAELNVIVPQTLIVDGKEYEVKVTKDTYISNTNIEDKTSLNADLTPPEIITNKENQSVENEIISEDKASNSLVAGAQGIIPNTQENSNVQVNNNAQENSNLQVNNNAQENSNTQINNNAQEKNNTLEENCVKAPIISANQNAPAATSNISLNATSLKLSKGKTETLTATVTPSSNTIVWTTSNAGVATVDSSGKVTAVNYGSATITAALQDGSGLSASATVVVGAKIAYVLDGGTNHADNPSAHYKEAVELKVPTRAGYIFKGWYEDDKYKNSIGKINESDNRDYTLYAKWEKVSLNKARISSLTNKKGKKLIVKIRKLSQASGYEIIYSTDRSFKKDSTTITTASTKTTITSLTKRKNYYVKVRAYIVDSTGNKVFGSYGAVKKIKIKK